MDKVSGKLYAWGANHTGMMGQGEPGEDIITPMLIAGLPELIDVAVGSTHAYGLDCQGQVWSWGWDSYEGLMGRGQLDGPGVWMPSDSRRRGVNTLDKIPDDGGIASPGLVLGLPKINKVVPAEGNVFVLTESGEVWGWGEPACLGNRSKSKQKEPVKIEQLDNIIDLFASSSGSAFYALDNSGQLYSWGNGYEGELGFGKRRNQLEPQVIPGVINPKKVSAGDFHCWAISEADELLFWGSGQYFDITKRNSFRILEPEIITKFGQISDLYTNQNWAFFRNSNGEIITIGHASVCELFDWQFDETETVHLFMLDAFQTIALGSDHGLAIDKQHRLFAFGDAGYGALANGETKSQRFYLPAQVELPGKAIKAVAGNHCSFALVADN